MCLTRYATPFMVYAEDIRWLSMDSLLSYVFIQEKMKFGKDTGDTTP